MSLKNGWSGGQYSLFRAIFGLYLLVHLLELLPWSAEVFSNQGVLPDASASPLLRLFPNILALSDAPASVAALIGAGAILAIFFAVGKWDRAAALGVWYVLACLFGRNPLISNPALPFLGWMLLAHACLPRAPYGSWEARGRPDPAGGWRMPAALFAAAWIVLALAYGYSGYTKLASPSWMDGTAVEKVLRNPLARPGVVNDLLLGFPSGMLRAMTWGALGLELVFAPLALFARLRPLVWTAMLAMHAGLVLLIDFADLSIGMILMHLFTLDPAWITPRRARGTDLVFYDGTCGLCHHTVRFLLAEDRSDSAFRFAPLGGQTFDARITPAARAELPDTIVVLTESGLLRVRSDAALYLMSRLGGIWRALAIPGYLLPRALRDRIYDLVARMRSRLFAAPAGACPILPKHLRDRFDP